MVVHVQVGYNEYAMVNTSFRLVEKDTNDKYYKHKDEKWRAFCKKHKFHPQKDANGKIYHLYLRLCAENLI